MFSAAMSSFVEFICSLWWHSIPVRSWYLSWCFATYLNDFVLSDLISITVASFAFECVPHEFLVLFPLGGLNGLFIRLLRRQTHCQLFTTYLLVSLSTLVIKALAQWTKKDVQYVCSIRCIPAAIVLHLPTYTIYNALQRFSEKKTQKVLGKALWNLAQVMGGVLTGFWVASFFDNETLTCGTFEYWKLPPWGQHVLTIFTWNTFFAWALVLWESRMRAEKRVAETWVEFLIKVIIAACGLGVADLTGLIPGQKTFPFSPFLATLFVTGLGRICEHKKCVRATHLELIEPAVIGIVPGGLLARALLASATVDNDKWSAMFGLGLLFLVLFEMVLAYFFGMAKYIPSAKEEEAEEEAIALERVSRAERAGSSTGTSTGRDSEAA